MKLALHKLEFDSYATQLNEKEITQVKGGSTKPCEELYFQVVVLPAVIAVGVAVNTGVLIPIETLPPPPFHTIPGTSSEQ